MSPKKIKEIIKELGVPTAYYKFAEDTKQEPPFICYFFGGGEDFIADNINYLKLERLYIELYTDRKDFAIESKLEKLLNRNGIVYSKDEENIDSEHMHVTIYTTTINLEVEE